MLRKIRKMLKHQEGFTLVELMIVVVILGILAGVGIQQYGKVQENARIAAHNANVKVITSAANMYIMTNETDGTGVTIKTLVDEGYLDAVPVNPFPETTGRGEQYSIKITPPEGEEVQWNIDVTPGQVDATGKLIPPDSGE